MAGDPKYNTFHRRLMSPIERFNDGYNIDSNGCWIWKRSIKGKRGAPSSHDRGQFWYRKKNMIASVASWMLFNGDIPSGLFVCHTCDVGMCVNPGHLFLGTSKENSQDMIRKGRHRPVFGEKNHNAKLNKKQVSEIRNSNEKGAILSRIYGVGKMQISRIKRGLQWRRTDAKS